MIAHVVVHIAYWTMHTLEHLYLHSPAVPLMAAETCTLTAIRHTVVITAFVRDILYRRIPSSAGLNLHWYMHIYANQVGISPTTEMFGMAVLPGTEAP